MRRRSFTITAAVVAGLALGIIFGPTAGSSTASAQTEPPAATQTAAPFQSLQNLFLDKLAGALNIQRPALDSAITSAATGTVDEALQQGTLTQAQADAIRARLEAVDLGALWGGRGFKRGGESIPGVKDAMRDAAAQTLGITTDELSTQLRSGQTVAQLAQANGTSEQAVIDAALAAARTQLDQAVAAGTVTQAQADAKYAELQQRGANLFMHRGGHGPRGGPNAPAGNPTTLAPVTPTAAADA